MAIQFDHTANGLVTITTTNAASPSPYTLRLPNGTGSDGQFLTTDGTGNLSFTSAATSYESLTSKAVANVLLSGDVAGSANVILQANSTVIAITTTIQPNSVALGTDTTGNYVANVVAGTGLVASGGGSENSNVTVSLPNSGVVATTYGNATIVPVITVDAQGRITAASNVNISGIGGTTDYTALSNKPSVNVTFTGDVTGAGNVLLSNGGTNSLSIALTVAADSVALGTDTTGQYVANLVQGSGITLTGLTGEGATPTISANVTSVGSFTGAVSNTNLLSSILQVDGTGSNLDADLLDGQQGTYYLDWTNVTNKPDPVITVTMTGDVTGSASATLQDLASNTISIATTIAADSVALGTDTTGNYTNRVVAGTGITATGTADEGNVITVGLTNTAVTPATYGNARIIPSFTVDQQGRLTAASNVTLLSDVANIILTGDVTGSANAILGPNSTTISISTTVAPNSVALGTDTTGNYTDRVVPGVGLTVTGTADEGNVITVAHLDTSSVANVSSDNSNGVVIQDLTLGFDTFGHVTSASVATANLDTRYLGLTSKASDSDLLDGLDSTHFLNYVNTVNRPAANIALTGDVTGSANASLLANSTILSIAATLTNSGVSASTYGNARIIPVITVDSKGRITAASNVTHLPDAANIVLTGDVTGAANVILGPNTTTISIATTVAPDSVALGTDTTGNYVANVVAGTGLLASGGGSETSVVTVSHADTSSVGNVSSNNDGGVVIQDLTLGFDTFGHVTSATVATANLDTRYLGISSKAADSDKLDGQDGTYYLDWTNTTNKPGPVVNVTLTGDVTGSASATLTDVTSNTITISTTIAANSVALGTDTTGNYTDRVVAGTGISATGTADEGNVITVGLSDTGVVANTYGNATVVPVITVDAQGRITSASNVTISASGGGGGGASLDAQKNFAVVDACALTSTGCHNIFIGENAGRCTTFGKYNFFAGKRAGFCNTTGCYNNFFGAYAGNCNTTGSFNNFFGRCAGFCNTSGSNNNFFGQCAGRCNTTGCHNNFFGFCAGQTNTTGGCNNFFGLYAGICNATGSNNNFFGFYAGSCNTTGCYNNFFGRAAGLRNTTGIHNNFFGFCAGQANTTGGCNNFFGLYAGRCNTTGINNNFIGRSAGLCNTTGCNNNFFGRSAGCSNTTGRHNNFFGCLAGSGASSASGSFNNFAGLCAGFCNSTGGCNNFFGCTAGFFNTTGGSNNFFGPGAGFRNTTGCYNNFFGLCAGFCNSTGNNNIIVGCLAGVGAAGLCNVTTESNHIIMGNSSHTQALIQIAWTAVSDARDKCIFGPVPHGRSFLNKVNPIAFAFKDRQTNQITDPPNKKRYGFSAQEIAELEGDDAVIANKNNHDKYFLTSDYLVPVLVNGIKELSAELETVKKRLEALENK